MFSHVLHTNLKTHSHRKQPLEITDMIGTLYKFCSFYCLHFFTSNLLFFFLKVFYKLPFSFQSLFFSLSLSLVMAFESNVFLTSEISNLFLHLLFSFSLFLCLCLSYPPTLTQTTLSLWHFFWMYSIICVIHWILNIVSY